MVYSLSGRTWRFSTDNPKTCHLRWSSARSILTVCLLRCISLSSFHFFPGLPSGHFLRGHYSTDTSCLVSDAPNMDLLELKLLWQKCITEDQYKTWKLIWSALLGHLSYLGCHHWSGSQKITILPSLDYVRKL
jgi:hypothetical protein